MTSPGPRPPASTASITTTLQNVTKRNLALRVKRPRCANTLFGGRSSGSQIALWKGERGNRCPVGHATGSRDMVMWHSSTPSFGACLRHGGVGGANRGDCPSGLSTQFAPMPPGTDTARSADRL